jgi:hypothetical protein
MRLPGLRLSLLAAPPERESFLSALSHLHAPFQVISTA